MTLHQVYPEAPLPPPKESNSESSSEQASDGEPALDSEQKFPSHGTCRRNFQ